MSYCFSSRRRHPGYWRDGGSDVSSSDLVGKCSVAKSGQLHVGLLGHERRGQGQQHRRHVAALEQGGESKRHRDGKFICSIGRDRKSTRLNSSHANISYAVFCLKKKKIAIKAECVHSH